MVTRCRTQLGAEASVGAPCCDLPSACALPPASLEPVCWLLLLLFRLNARCLKLLRSEPGRLGWLTHKFVSRLKTACSDLLLSRLGRWQQPTDPHFLPGERWQLFEKRIPIERCNPAPLRPAFSRGQRAPPCGDTLTWVKRFFFFFF